MPSRTSVLTPGSPAARRVALVRLVLRLALNHCRAGLIPAAIFFTVVFMRGEPSDIFILVFLAPVFTGNLLVHTNPGAAEWLALLPGSRREKFHALFFSAAAVTLIISGAAALCLFMETSGEWTSHIAMAALWIPLALLTYGFTRIKIDPGVGLVLGLCLVGITTGGMIWLIAFRGAAPGSFIVPHGLAAAGILTWLYRRARNDFLTGEFRFAVPEAETTEEIRISEPAARTPMPAAHRTPGPVASERPRSVAVPRKTSGCAFAPVPAKQRRAALYRLAYDGTKTRALWFAGIWFVLLIALPPVGQMLVHALFVMLFGEYVMLRRWRLPGSKDYVLMLPVSRREFLWLRVWPVLALTVFMAFAGFFFSQVVSVWNVGGISHEYLPAAVLAGPFCLCVFGVPALVWPGRISGIFGFIWLLSYLPRHRFPGFPMTPAILIAGALALMALAVGISFWGIGRLQSSDGSETSGRN